MNIYTKWSTQIRMDSARKKWLRGKASQHGCTKKKILATF